MMQHMLRAMPALMLVGSLGWIASDAWAQLMNDPSYCAASTAHVTSTAPLGTPIYQTNMSCGGFCKT